MSKEDDRLAAIEGHIRNFWNGHIIESATWKQGPVRQQIPKFSTYRVFPVQAGEPWVYVTAGCSLGEPDAGGVEFFILSPMNADIHSETLAMVGHYHSFEVHRLTIGSIVNIGRPWMPGSRMDHLLVSLPYPYGPRLEWAPPEAGGVQFLWLLPIHQSEAEFIKRKTLDEFEAILEDRNVNVLDVDRVPII